MTRGILDTLTVLEHSLIKNGIKWVKREIRQRCGEAGIKYSKAKWRGFWESFQRTWLELYDTSVWNVAGLSNELVARTNNPLERFNRVLNDRFPKPRPIVGPTPRAVVPKLENLEFESWTAFDEYWNRFQDDHLVSYRVRDSATRDQYNRRHPNNLMPAGFQYAFKRYKCKLGCQQSPEDWVSECYATIVSWGVVLGFELRFGLQQPLQKLSG
ncbi:unnamed protein product [Phytophthora fragariaefolia]|uniref:Unnamed protein product n=1 Tax=Phytophthora fragariaefolia TaxID=1490495 RepID=A0A9W6XI87_9STRA|nr:unnamed protein product [Phytophthora fragariaefolia]